MNGEFGKPSPSVHSRPVEASLGLSDSLPPTRFEADSTMYLATLDSEGDSRSTALIISPGDFNRKSTQQRIFRYKAVCLN